MKTIAVLNMKGGVGKTTTTINFASILVKDYKQRVLVIDADPQGNLSQFLLGEVDPDFTTLQLLKDGSEFYPDFISHSKIEGVDIVPADMTLLAADVADADDRPNLRAIADLRDCLIEDDAYDYLLIDCPPAFSAGTLAALMAATEVLIPVRLDAFSTGGMVELTVQVNNMRKVNPVLRISGLLLTMYRPTELSIQTENFLRGDNRFRVFNTTIRYSDKVGDSTFAANALMDFSPRSAACVDYRRFVREYLGGADK